MLVKRTLSEALTTNMAVILTVKFEFRRYNSPSEIQILNIQRDAGKIMTVFIIPDSKLQGISNQTLWQLTYLQKRVLNFYS